MLRDILRLSTALVSAGVAVYLISEIRYYTNGRRALLRYAALVAAISALFRTMVVTYDMWPEGVQAVLRAGDISAVIVILVAIALATVARGMR